MGITSDTIAVDQLETKYNVPAKRVPMHRAEYSDRIMSVLSEIAGSEIPEAYRKRGEDLLMHGRCPQVPVWSTFSIYGDPEWYLACNQCHLKWNYPVLVALQQDTCFREHAQKGRRDEPRLRSKDSEGLDFDASTTP